MAKITRKVQKIFGQNAALNEIAEFGSLAASTPTFTTDPDVIQALAQYLGGWFDAVIGGNSPAIEDMNALCYLYAYQLAYLMQTGVPEWNAETTYYIGSLAQDSTGFIYASIVDNNLNNAFTVAGKWKQISGLTYNTPAPLTVTVVSGQSLMNPNTVISSSAVYTVNTGGAFYSVDVLTVNGTLTVNGKARVI